MRSCLNVKVTPAIIFYTFTLFKHQPVDKLQAKMHKTDCQGRIHELVMPQC